jgi:signal transduction histidine kinase
VKSLVLRLWPKSLAARLAVLLVTALAFAQLALVVVFHNQQDAIAEETAHGQALNQTAVLARLLETYPASDGARLSGAFGSKFSCARVDAAPPLAHEMSTTEQGLANLLSVMLHGVKAGQPQVAIEPVQRVANPCEGDATLYGRKPENGKNRHAAPLANLRRFASVGMSVPLSDGRWLTMVTAVHAPGKWTRATFLSFLLSCVSVAGVAFFAVRRQTRSLRELANASERLGRGESVEALSTAGPSEVASAARAFNTMQERLSAFLRDRLRLLAGISHDLRTPLTTLRLKAEFIEDETVREDVIATIDEMTAICEATLAFTRAEATTEASQMVDIPKLIADVAEAFRLAGDDVVVATSPPLSHVCRPVSLKRAVRNLMENAVRYGGGARVSVNRDREAVIIAVEDDGPGVPEDMVEEAFKPFVRLEASRSMETGGMGLGLAIARSIVKAHGGVLKLINLPQGGLKAEIRLPLEKA